MLEIIFLIASISAIVTMARRRGSDVVLWGGMALGGFIVLGWAGTAYFAARHLQDWMIFSEIAGWAWIGGVFLFVRFAVGASKPKPWGMWSCPECHYLNASNAVVCEACSKPYAPSRKPNL